MHKAKAYNHTLPDQLLLVLGMAISMLSSELSRSAPVSALNIIAARMMRSTP
jgi:hypothetical protein